MSNSQQSAASAQPIVNKDLACLECGYNLRGLREDGHCPECGRQIRLTLHPAVTRGENWWKSISAGGLLCAITVVLSSMILWGVPLLIALIPAAFMVRPLGAVLLLIAGWPIAFLGVLMVTAPTPGLSGTAQGLAGIVCRRALLVILGGALLGIVTDHVVYVASLDLVGSWAVWAGCDLAALAFALHVRRIFRDVAGPGRTPRVLTALTVYPAWAAMIAATLALVLGLTMFPLARRNAPLEAVLFGASLLSGGLTVLWLPVTVLLLSLRLRWLAIRQLRIPTARPTAVPAEARTLP